MNSAAWPTSISLRCSIGSNNLATKLNVVRLCCGLRLSCVLSNFVWSGIAGQPCSHIAILLLISTLRRVCAWQC
jgi:hypothetical protein